jgi:hypothetical protein
MSDIDKKLANAASVGPEQYFAQVFEATRLLHDRFNNPFELTGVIHGNDIARIRELLSVSLILNDRTSVRYLGKGELKVKLFSPEAYESAFGSDKVIFKILREDLKKHSIDPQNPNLLPSYFYSEGKEMKPLMNAALSFIKDGALAFQPSRAITAKRSNDIDGKSSWALISANENRPLDDWQPESESRINQPLPVILNHSTNLGSTLFEVTIPFVKGVPFKDLHALLLDESDIVSSFRSSLKSIVRDAEKTGLSTQEMVHDIIDPKVSALGKKLKTLHRIHRLKVGGASLGSVALACTAASTGGVSAGLLATASAGGFGLLANQYSDYIAKRDELQSDPFYLLWRCRHSSQKV